MKSVSNLIFGIIVLSYWYYCIKYTVIIIRLYEAIVTGLSLAVFPLRFGQVQICPRTCLSLLKTDMIFLEFYTNLLRFG